VIDPGPASRTRELVGQIGRAEGAGPGVRHLEDRRHAAERRGGRAAGEILLVLQPRLAEMHLGVDDAGQHMEAIRRQHLARVRRRKVADGGDSPLRHGHVHALGARGRDRGSIAHDEIVTCPHLSLPVSPLLCRRGSHATFRFAT
jgi:hypothetical protein